MLNNPDYVNARDLILSKTQPIGSELVALQECGGRILAQNVTALETIPPFDRSPYDGYAFRSTDTAGASTDAPCILRVVDELPAGSVSSVPVTCGTAVRLMTGAPLPAGADAILPFERTTFTRDTVAIFSPVKSGQNVIRAGEDVHKGQQLAHTGDVIDPGTVGTLAAQGITAPEVYRISKVGILSTGSELAEITEVIDPHSSKIRNTNRYTFEALVRSIGCEPIYLGAAKDDVSEISILFKKGIDECDAVISTGGVSVGDYDLTPDAMQQAGITLLFRGVDMKPGMACAYGVYQGKPIFGLSGNPASALTNFYAVALPALRKRMGCRTCLPAQITVRLAADFDKSSPKTRFLRGTLDLSDGTARIVFSKEQGNVVLSSMIGCNVLGMLPAGSGPVRSGTEIRGFLL